jgi:hypothetical protein
MIRIGVRSFVSAGGGTDADAQAFITAAGITDATQQSAINTLVTDLKGYSIWTKMKAIYPFCGGTSSTHKWNLKDPRDLDAAFRLVFNGGWTHSSTGATPNGTNAYADTKLNANSILTLNNTHLSYYSRTNNAGTSIMPSLNGKVEMGLQILASTSFFMSIRSYGGNQICSMYHSSSNFLSVSNGNSDCFITNTRTSSTSLKSFKNGSQLGSTVTLTNAGTLPNDNVFIACNGNSSSRYEYSDRQCAFASIGDGLTDTEAANFYTAVQAYQTTLSRNV